MRSYYVPGEWNVICPRCGEKYKSSALRLEWTGQRVCKYCWEARHPQDLLQVPRESIAVPWSAPEPTDVFLDTSDPWTTETGEYITDQLGLPFYTG